MKTVMTVMDGYKDPYDVEVDLADKPGLDALKAVVRPHMEGFEHVSVLHNGVAADMFVHDEGAKLELPRNDPATGIYRANWMALHPGTDPETLPFIYGPAVVFSRRVWF